MDVVSARLQIQGPGVVAYSSAWHAASSIVRAEGVGGLFRGMGAQVRPPRAFYVGCGCTVYVTPAPLQVLAFGPASALWWATYEGVNSLLLQQAAAAAQRTAVHGSVDTDCPSDAAASMPTPASPLWMHAVSGLVAGLATSVVTNPIEVAKTRLQTQHSLLTEFDAQVRRVEEFFV